MMPTSEYLGGGPFDDLSPFEFLVFHRVLDVGGTACWDLLDLSSSSEILPFGCRVQVQACSASCQASSCPVAGRWERGGGWGLRVCPAAAAGLLAVTLSRLVFLLRTLRGLDNDCRLPSPRPIPQLFQTYVPGPRLAFGGSRTS